MATKHKEADSLDQLITTAMGDGTINFFNDRLTSANFEKTEIRDGLALMNPKKDLDLEGYFFTPDVLAAMKHQSHEPANPYELAQFMVGPGWDRETTVIALGLVWHDTFYGGDYVGGLWSYSGIRRLDLSDFGLVWYEHYRFLGVPTIS